MTPRKLLRIARWEVSTAAGGIDRRTAVLGALALALAGGVAVAAATGAAGAPNAGLYPVGVSEDSPFREPVADATALRPVGVNDDRAVVVVRDTRPADREATVRAVDSQTGRAALAAFRDAVERHNARLMAAQPNESAAFPVSVTLSYVTRDGVLGTAGTGDADGDPSGSADAGAGTDGDDGSDTTTDGVGENGGNGGAAENGDTAGGTGGDGSDGGGGALAVPEVGDGGLFGGTATGSPADIAPPFPFGSLVLAFVFLVPMNFLIQAYGSSVLAERVNRRGEPMLVAPVSRLDVVAGKTLPYLLGAILVTVLVTAGITLATGPATTAGPVAVAAVVPVAFVFLAATFLGAMFARSFKELTFLTVTVSVTLTTYVFVPAIFTTITPVALISPLTLVVRDLQATGVGFGEYLFSTGPFYLAGSVMFLLGIGVYREEDMFTQRSVPAKLIDALDAQLSGTVSVGLLSAALVPFVFVAELLGVALLVAVPQGIAVPALLALVAVVEETAKAIHAYAGFRKRRFARTGRTALRLGVASGLGFFLAEKTTAVVQVVGLDRLPLGQAAFAADVGSGLSAVGVFAAALFAPLALHTVTTAVASLGAIRGRRTFAGTLSVAVVLHFAYDLLVVVVLYG